MNNISLVGRLCNDPEQKEIGGKTLTEFRIAVDKRFKPKDGGNSADFFNIKIWGKDGDFVFQYIGKGRLVAVSGRMESRKYKNKEGVDVERWDVTAESITSLEKGQRNDGAATSPRAKAAAIDSEDPFADE